MHFRRGFTLVELLAVIAMIAILASLIMAGFSAMDRNKSVQKCKLQIGLLANALEEYKSDFGRYPVANDTDAAGDTGANVLFKALYWDSDNDLVGATNASGTTVDTNQRIYLVELDPLSNKQGWRSAKTAGDTNTIFDPWGENFRYRSGVDGAGVVNSDCKNPDFDLWSLGPDLKPGNAGGTDKDAQDNISNWK